MASTTRYSLTGDVLVKASKEATEEILSVHSEGAGKVGGNLRTVTSIKLKQGGTEVSITFENRLVDVADYTLDPTTGEWEVNAVEASEVGPWEDALAGKLKLENGTVAMDVLNGVQVYRLTGQIPGGQRLPDSDATGGY